jgi:hypothetical protein
LFFPWKTYKVRGLCAKWRMSSSLRQQAPACPAQDHRRPPPACHLLLPGDEVTPGDSPRCHATSPSFFPPPGRFPLSLPCRLQARAWPPPSLAAPRLPCFRDQPRSTASPSYSSLQPKLSRSPGNRRCSPPFPSQFPTATASNCSLPTSPLAKPTSPASSG